MDDEHTQAAEPIPDATAPAPSADETESIYAWSHGDDDGTVTFQRRSWKLPIAVAVLAVAAVATVGVVKVWPHHSTPRSPGSPAVHTVPPASAPVKPPAPAPALQPITTDDQFIADLASHWGPIPDRPQTIHDGLSVCSLIARGADKTTIEQDLVNKKILDTPDAEFFVNTAAAHYCPQG